MPLQPLLSNPEPTTEVPFDTLNTGLKTLINDSPINPTQPLPNHITKVIEQQKKKVGEGKEEEIKKQIAEDAKNSYPILHEDVRILLEKFLEYKKQNLSKEEKKIYEKLSLEDFITRLLTKRPLAFYDQNDITATKKNQTKPSNRDKPSEEFISYEEMQLAALLGMSSPSYFINNGDKNNKGIPPQNTDEFIDHGIIVGQVGARFEKEDVMEHQHMLITSGQNTKEKGYGAKNTNVPQALQKHWAKFYGITHFPTYEEAEKKYNEETDNGKNPEKAKTYIKIDDNYLNAKVYKIRMKKIVETFLQEADARAAVDRKKAYVHATGLGLGVWAISRGKQIQADLILEAYAEVLKEQKFEHIADIDFAWFDSATKFMNRDISNEVKQAQNTQIDSIIQDALKGTPNADITIHVSRNRPHARTTHRENKLLVTQYAWDGGSYPGNEFWNGSLTASMDPATACSSGITYLQSPINPNVNGKYAQIATQVPVPGLKAIPEAKSDPPTPTSPLCKTTKDFQQNKTKELAEKLITNNTNTLKTTEENNCHVIKTNNTPNNTKNQNGKSIAISANTTIAKIPDDNTIECPLVGTLNDDNKANYSLLTEQQQIFIEFLRHHDEQAKRDNTTITIEASNFNPEDLKKIIEEMKGKNLNNIELKILEDPNDYKYTGEDGNTQTATTEQIKAIQDSLNASPAPTPLRASNGHKQK